MKNQIISLTTFFASLLLIVIVFTAFSSVPTKVERYVETVMAIENNGDRALLFANEDSQFEFTEPQYNQVVEVIKHADSLASYWQGKDSTVLIRIGVVDTITFDYRYYQYSRTHFIILKNQKDSVYFNKYTTFVDRLRDN